MYKLVLILRYLRRKIAPMFALLAVMLCTAMVIVVISVMGGFLAQMMDALHRLDGDVTVSSGLAGFPYYEQLQARLEARPEIHAAAPFIETLGLVTIGNRAGGSNDLRFVQVMGIDPAPYNRVLDYQDMLHWTRERRQAESVLVNEDLTGAGARLEVPPHWPLSGHPAAVPGIAVTNLRHWDTNDYTLAYSRVTDPLTLTVMRLPESGGAVSPQSRQFTIVNEFKSGAYEVDRQRVYVSLDQLQRMLLMDAAPAADDPAELLPGRVTHLVVRGTPGVPLPAIAAAVEAALVEFRTAHPDVPGLYAETWQDRYSTMIAAVSNEKGLITFLFAIISLVAFVMVATTFYNIVLEKTRDIGVLRALGASRLGVAGIFLGYGLALGIVGAGLGCALASAIVINLNEIQDFIAATTGWRMWDPEIYVFDRIPGRLDAVEVVAIMIGSVLSSVLGSTIPALVAARVNPVEALRYE